MTKYLSYLMIIVALIFIYDLRMKYQKQEIEIQALRMDLDHANKQISDMKQSIDIGTIICETITQSSNKIACFLSKILNVQIVKSTRKVEVTAYCDCKKCNGKHAGKTASGKCPQEVSDRTKGSIAADTRHYPFGTEIYIPGYGWGVVEDRGGAIKGPNKLDIFFDDHETVKHWGRQYVEVEIYRKASA